MNKEIKRLEWFMSGSLAQKPIKMITADEAFINYSERGIKPDFSKILNPLRFHQLKWAKIWQGRQLQMWEDGNLDGVGLGHWTLLGGEDPNEIMPRNIVDFMKKEMFKGMDKDIIENTYQDILKYWTWWRRLLYKIFKK